ncbi:DUF29 family protein [Phormidium tenue]|jgi:hypothetical protein|uniref:DUF29 family protein n=1 Tax=Phormidium tenue FACHB-1050 TaxID=2692857 RepID=A0ABR8C7F8_9CYAN|nr:DUF29 family protein [Phormidium tenue]MBD2316599.1 DUF29 family protein [Phormidium tenue FACHB-1050]
MEELLTLKELLVCGDIPAAMVLVEEMTEMSKDDKISKIFSYSIILLVHLIKQKVEKRTKRSWDLSIYNSTTQIRRANQRRKAKGTYLSQLELSETLAEAYDIALSSAAIEAFEGRYEADELAAMCDRDEILADAVKLIEQESVN